MNFEEIKESLDKLRMYIESQNFKGYDPYDILNSKIKFNVFGKWIPVLAVQVQKRNPVNLRPILGIKKEYNPKAMGLLLHAYSLLYELEPQKDTEEKMHFLFNWLIENYSQGYSGHCWGYNFDWASPKKYLRAFTPSIVVTTFVAKGIFQYYSVTKNPKALDILSSSCRFILDDLLLTETEYGVCFSYTPIEKDCCFNANMLGAELLAKVYSLTQETRLLENAKNAVDFTLKHQYDDGHWNYSFDLHTGKEREQIDFHQGFILDSLCDFIHYAKMDNNEYCDALFRGAEFYQSEQFFKNGRSKWRIPKVWPVDIHNQAQGIITFSKLGKRDEKYLNFASTIVHWTIALMQNKKGYFYYRKNRIRTNRISYMRWAQAWMFLALMHLLANLGHQS